MDQITTQKIDKGRGDLDLAYRAINRASIADAVLCGVHRVHCAVISGGHLGRIGTGPAMAANALIAWARASIGGAANVTALRMIEIAEERHGWERAARLAHPLNAEVWHAVLSMSEAISLTVGMPRSSILARNELRAAMHRLAAYRAGLVIDKSTAKARAAGYDDSWHPWKLARSSDRPITPWRAMAGHMHICGHIDEPSMLKLIDECSDAFMNEIRAWQ